MFRPQSPNGRQDGGIYPNGTMLTYALVQAWDFEKSILRSPHVQSVCASVFIEALFTIRKKIGTLPNVLIVKCIIHSSNILQPRKSMT